MSRGLQSAIATAIASPSLAPVLLYQGEWASGTARYWTGYGDRSWNSQTWTGIGTLGRITEVVETTETRIEGITVELDGVPATMVSLVLGQNRHGLAGTLYFGTVDASDVLTADTVFVGRQDAIVLEDAADFAKIQVRYLSRLADMRRTNSRRFTHEDLTSEYSDDRGLEFLAAVQDAHIQWGGSWRWP